MSLFDRLLAFLAGIFGSEPQREQAPPPPVRYSDISISEASPANSSIQPGTVYAVVPGGRAKWVLFRCPCSCGQVVTLSLQQQHHPHWQITQSESGRAILHPSIWRDKGCNSHFWVRDGRVYWCDDTGRAPIT